MQLAGSGTMPGPAFLFRKNIFRSFPEYGFGEKAGRHSLSIARAAGYKASRPL